jgi:hypothetical protein
MQSWHCLFKVRWNGIQKDEIHSNEQGKGHEGLDLGHKRSLLATCAFIRAISG